MQKTLHICCTFISTYLDNDVGHVHAPAQSRQPDNQLNGVNIMGNHHQRSLSLLHKSCDVVDAILDDHRLLFVSLQIERKSVHKCIYTAETPDKIVSTAAEHKLKS